MGLASVNPWVNFYNKSLGIPRLSRGWDSACIAKRHGWSGQKTEIPQVGWDDQKKKKRIAIINLFCYLSSCLSILLVLLLRPIKLNHELQLLFPQDNLEITLLILILSPLWIKNLKNFFTNVLLPFFIVELHLHCQTYVHYITYFLWGLFWSYNYVRNCI